MAVRMQVQGMKNIRDRIDARAKDKSAHVQRFSALVRDLVGMAEAIADQVDAPDPTLNTQANFLKLTKNVTKAHKRSTEMVNDSGALLTEALADLERRENERLGFNKGNADRTAIVAKFSTLSTADQTTQIAAWMKDPKAGPLLGIVFGADPFLTGLTPDIVSRFRADTVKTHAPELANERDEINDQHEAVIAIARSMQMIKDATADVRRVEEIQRQKAAHDAANATFAGNAA